MSKRTYSGPALNCAYQSITERPELEESDDVVYVTEPEDLGEETTTNVPMPGGESEDVERPQVPGQTTLAEWGGQGE